ncbi:hypothetical protein GCM10028818_57360 [Spirosoma horti]
MIHKDAFTADWLRTVSEQFGKSTDLKLLEKVVRALSLMEQLRLQRVTKQAQFLFLQDGMKRLNNLIVNNFCIDNAIVVGAKAAYLNRRIKGSQSEIQRHQKPVLVPKWQFTYPSFNRLNNLKKISVETFYYWYRALSG